MAIKLGVHVLVDGRKGFISGIDGDTLSVTCGEDTVTCASSEVKTLKGRPRKIVPATVEVAAEACEAECDSACA